MGMREGTIRVTVHRALQQLRTLAQKQGEGAQEQVAQRVEISQVQGTYNHETHPSLPSPQPIGGN